MLLLYLKDGLVVGITSTALILCFSLMWLLLRVRNERLVVFVSQVLLGTYSAGQSRRLT